MTRATLIVRGALFVGAAATALACESDNDVLGIRPVDGIFASYVAIGNSITAGFQSDGINDSTQAQAYPVLLAAAMHTRFAFPALAMPGCRPPIDNFQTQTRVTLPGQPASTANTCALRDPASVTAILNNVAVPGIATADPTAVVGPNQSPLTQLFLGGETMVQKAIDADPTFSTVWVGNNDVLGPAIRGLPGLATPQATFVQNYSGMIAELQNGTQNLRGVLIGVVQVSNAPVFFTARALKNPQFVAALSQGAGQTITVLPNCFGADSLSLIAIPIIAQMRPTANPQHPPIISCAPITPGGVGDLFVLTATEQLQTAAIITGYNNYIHAKADSIGFAYYDPNVTLARLATTDQVLATHVPNLASATATFGQFVTLDGIHPSAAAHIEIAKDLMTIINDRYGTHLEPASSP